MSPEKLLSLAHARKCVVWRTIRMPAAFVISMQFWRVMSMLPVITEYTPKAKPASKTDGQE